MPTTDVRTWFVRPPALRLPDRVREDLEAHRRGLADETERMLTPHARPCVAITAKRVSPRPLRRRAVARLFGARSSSPELGPLASKFGGTPYCEDEEEWQRYRFLGQIDLAEATSVLPPETIRLRGLLRIDCSHEATLTHGFRVRWFPNPDASRALAATAEPVGRWETLLAFALAWTLPEGKTLEDLWPLHDGPRWFDYERFYPAGYNEDGFDEFHRMLGHKTSGLDEHYGFKPPPGCSEDIDEYDSLLRLTFDNNADFGWGTNWVHLLVPREDLARGDLSRIVVTGANS